MTFSPTTDGRALPPTGVSRQVDGGDIAAATAPGGRKWRGGFATDFPRSAKSGTSGLSEPMVSQSHGCITRRALSTQPRHGGGAPRRHEPAFRRSARSAGTTGGDGRTSSGPSRLSIARVQSVSHMHMESDHSPSPLEAPHTYLKSGGGTPRGWTSPSQRSCEAESVQGPAEWLADLSFPFLHHVLTTSSYYCLTCTAAGHSVLPGPGEASTGIYRGIAHPGQQYNQSERRARPDCRWARQRLRTHPCTRETVFQHRRAAGLALRGAAERQDVSTEAVDAMAMVL